MLKWLHDNGVLSDRITVSQHSHAIKFDASLSEVEQLLQTEYHLFEHSESGDEGISTAEYSVPEHLKKHIEFISPTVGMATITKRSRSSRASHKGRRGLPKSIQERAANSDPLSNCPNAMTPACIRALYSIPEKGATPFPGNEIGLIHEDIGPIRSWNASNLRSFLEHLTDIPPNTQPNTIGLQGGATGPSKDANGDYDLDLALALSIVYPQKVNIYEVNDTSILSSHYDPFYSWLDPFDKVIQVPIYLRLGWILIACIVFLRSHCQKIQYYPVEGLR